jgi:hypothetical protein
VVIGLRKFSAAKKPGLPLARMGNKDKACRIKKEAAMIEAYWMLLKIFAPGTLGEVHPLGISIAIHHGSRLRPSLPRKESSDRTFASTLAQTTAAQDIPVQRSCGNHRMKNRLAVSNPLNLP